MDIIVALIGLIGGLTVGIAGAGAGSLVTPLLMLSGMPSVQAVGTSLVAAAGAKFVGAEVHRRQGTVNLRLVIQLALGSVPAALVGIYVIKRLGTLDGAEPFVERALGVVLILIAISIVVDMFVLRDRAKDEPSAVKLPTDRVWLNVTIGAFVGFALSVTSAGSGTLVLAALLLSCRTTMAAELVGTTVFHGAILQAVAGAGHLALGSVDLLAVLALSLGYVPGIIIGSRFAARAPNMILRPILLVAIGTTAVKLI